MATEEIPKWRARWDALEAELTRDRLPRRVFKCVLATGLTVIISLLPHIREVYGTAAYLGSMTTVFGHPGRRLGSMVEALSLAAIGGCIGVAWASLGMYLGSLLYDSGNLAAMMGVRAVFLTIALFVHGYVRSSTPRLFLLVLLMIIPVLIGLTSPLSELTPMFPKQFLYPILTASAAVLLVNVAVFPEFGSTHLGLTTIETLKQTLGVQKSASALFVAYASAESSEATDTHLKELTAAKSELRKKVAGCKATLVECSFELAFSVLAPWELKPVAGKGIKRLVSSTISLVGACESEYALLGRPEEREQRRKADAELASSKGKQKETNPPSDDVDVRRKREIASGDPQLLRTLLRRVESPLNGLQATIDRSIDIISMCLAHAYDIPVLPRVFPGPSASLPRRPRGILLEELDIHIDTLRSAIDRFGRTSTDALEGAAELTHMAAPDEAGEVDVMPRDEVFLVCSFMLNLRQAANRTLDMLVYSRRLVELRMERGARKRLWFPVAKLRKWLFSGTEEGGDGPVPPAARGDDGGVGAAEEEVERRETLSRDKRKRKRRERTLRDRLANFVGWVARSEDVVYAFKLTLGVMLCSWPAFVQSWTQWFFHDRGGWVGIIFILVFENAVGSTIWIFALRAVGTVIGSVWGFAAYEARKGNTVVIAIMIMLGTVPSYWVQLGTKYTKAAMVCTISMCVVAVSTHLQTVPGSSSENFYKRTVTMLIGGLIATLVQIIILPSKARVGLKKCLATAIVQINKMESCIAFGVDETKNIISSPRLFKKFKSASKKAEIALTNAEAYLGFTRQEPRLKGSFESQEVVYKEIIYVLRQIVDRMENLLQMRKAYGSAVLEQYNARLYSYRRNVAASITIMLFACHEALTTKLPLPQFLPSARIAHLRMIVRIRQILLEEEEEEEEEQEKSRGDGLSLSLSPAEMAKQRALRLKFLSWNAAAAALEECIEYIEELVDLMKMLVGANEFRSGMLNRPTYREYVQQTRHVRGVVGEGEGGTGTATATGAKTAGTSLGRLTSRVLGSVRESEMEEIPSPLQRMQSRKAGGRFSGRVQGGVIVGRGLKQE